MLQALGKELRGKGVRVEEREKESEIEKESKNQNENESETCLRQTGGKTKHMSDIVDCIEPITFGQWDGVGQGEWNELGSSEFGIKESEISALNESNAGKDGGLSLSNHNDTGLSVFTSSDIEQLDTGSQVIGSSGRVELVLGDMVSQEEVRSDVPVISMLDRRSAFSVGRESVRMQSVDAHSLEEYSLRHHTYFPFCEQRAGSPSDSVSAAFEEIVLSNHDVHFGLLFSSPLVGIKRVGNDVVVKEIENLNFMVEKREVLESLVAEVRRSIRYRIFPASLHGLQLTLLQNVSVLHFSGHGTKEGELVFEDENGCAKLVNSEMLGQLLQKKGGSKNLRVVFIASCYSSNMAKTFIESGVEFVICCRIKEKIMDSSAIKFAKTFYHALFNGSHSVAECFSQALFQVKHSLHESESDKFQLLAHPESRFHVPQSNTWPPGPLLFTDLTSHSRMLDCSPNSLFRNLPATQQTTLIGRNKDLQKLFVLVRNSRFSMITGPTGIGKSAITKQLCQYVLDRSLFTDGIIYTGLQFCTTKQTLWRAIYQSIRKSLQSLQGSMHSMNIHPSPAQILELLNKTTDRIDSNTDDIKFYLTNHFSSYRVLFVFDDGEHPLLSNPVEFFDILEWFLSELPSCSILLTSTVSVSFTGISTPCKVYTLKSLSPIDAAKMFTQCSPRKIELDELIQRGYTPSVINTNYAASKTPSSTRPSSPLKLWQSNSAANIAAVASPPMMYSHLRKSRSGSSTSLGHPGHVNSVSFASQGFAAASHLRTMSQISPITIQNTASPILNHRLSVLGDLTRVSYLQQLAANRALLSLNGHPGSISIIAPLLLQYKMSELESLLVTQSLDDLILSNVPDEQRVVPFVKTIATSLDYLYRADKAAPAFFALFALLPAGAFTEDLEEIWPRSLTLPPLSRITAILNNEEFEEERDSDSHELTSTAGFSFLASLLHRMSLIVVTPVEAVKSGKNITSNQYSIYSFSNSSAEKILIHNASLREQLTLSCYRHFGTIAEQVHNNIATANVDFRPVYELFDAYEFNFWSCLQKWNHPAGKNAYMQSKGLEPVLSPYGKVAIYFATVLFLVGGRIESAWQACNVGLKGCIFLGDRFGENAFLKLMGILCYVQYQYDEAFKYFSQAQINYKYMKCALGQAICLNGMASVYATTQMHSKAVRVYEEALVIFKSVHHVHGQSNCLKRLTTLVSKSNEKSKTDASVLSQKYYKENRKLFVDNTDRQLQANVDGYISRWLGDDISLQLQIPLHINHNGSKNIPRVAALPSKKTVAKPVVATAKSMLSVPHQQKFPKNSSSVVLTGLAATSKIKEVNADSFLSTFQKRKQYSVNRVSKTVKSTDDAKLEINLEGPSKQAPILFEPIELPISVSSVEYGGNSPIHFVSSMANNSGNDTTGHFVAAAQEKKIGDISHPGDSAHEADEFTLHLPDSPILDSETAARLFIRDPNDPNEMKEIYDSFEKLGLPPPVFAKRAEDEEILPMESDVSDASVTRINSLESKSPHNEADHELRFLLRTSNQQLDQLASQRSLTASRIPKLKQKASHVSSSSPVTPEFTVIQPSENAALSSLSLSKKRPNSAMLLLKEKRVDSNKVSTTPLFHNRSQSSQNVAHENVSKTFMHSNESVFAAMNVFSASHASVLVKKFSL